MEERVGSTRPDRVPDDAGGAVVPGETVVVDPVFVVTQTFPARPSSIPEIRDFVLRYLRDAPLTAEGSQQVHHAVLGALLDAASPDGGQIQVCFRIFPDGVEVDDIGLARPSLDDVFLHLTGHRAEDETEGSDELLEEGVR